jgi:hypothetical protein
LLEPTTSREKFAHIRTLLYGINPQLDSALERAARELSTLDKVLGGDVISLTAENLPEQTDEQKRRKKAVVFFVGNWNTLKSEVARVEKELAAAKQADTPEGKVSHVKKIFNFAKGPLGITTIVAVGIVLTMQTVAVEVTIKNQGCSPMTPSGSLPIPLPGLSLPKEPIENGGSAVATIPGLTFTIDGTQRSSLNAKALGFSMGFQLSGSMQDVRLDGVSLLGKTTVARLSEKNEHELVFVCGR